MVSNRDDDTVGCMFVVAREWMSEDLERSAFYPLTVREDSKLTVITVNVTSVAKRSPAVEG